MNQQIILSKIRQWTILLILSALFITGIEVAAKLIVRDAANKAMARRQAEAQAKEAKYRKIFGDKLYEAINE